jgi:hypothetical protein
MEENREQPPAAPPPPPSPQAEPLPNKIVSNSPARLPPTTHLGNIQHVPPMCPTPTPHQTKGSTEKSDSKKAKILDRMRSRKTDLAETAALEDPIYSNDESDVSDEDEVNRSETMDSIEQHSSAEDDESVVSATGDRAAASPRKGATNGTMWKTLDPFLVSFTNSFNSLSCGPMSTFMSSSAADTDGGSTKSSEKSKQERKTKKEEVREDTDGESYDDQDIFSVDETEIEEREDKDEDVRDMDSYDQSDMLKDHFLSSSASSNSSVDSSQLMRELNSTSSSEGSIQVISSIRETMEKIVSKTKKGTEDDGNVDRTWLSYELRQDDTPETPASSVKPKPASAPEARQPNTPSKSGRKNFFFRKRSLRKQKT